MKKQWNYDEIYGELPFQTLRKIEFEVDGMQSRDDAAYLQYQLLTQEEIIRCHIEFKTKKGFLLYNQLEADSKKALSPIKKPFSAKITSETEIAYRELIAMGFHLE